MKYYAVKNGKKIGIYKDWASCKEQVFGFSGAEYKSFPTEEEAKNYIKGTSAPPMDESTVAYVDGSFNINTKEYSYGAVLIIDGKEECFNKKFSDPEMAEMRNVAGEITASSFIMDLCIERGIKSVIIRYDYMGIEAWATGAWKANKSGTMKYKKHYDQIKDKLQVRFEKVKGHSGDKYNDMADRLAKDALGIA